MFCDRCGATVPLNQRFCGTCGREFYATMPVLYVENRVQQHVRMLGILWTAYSALTALGGLGCFLAGAILSNLVRFGGPGGPPPFIHPLLNVIGTFVLIKAMFGFLAGWGLIHREPWARMLTIVLSFLAMFNLPFGTALGIYGLWVLLPAASEREYEMTAKKTSAA